MTGRKILKQDMQSCEVLLLPHLHSYWKVLALHGIWSCFVDRLVMENCGEIFSASSQLPEIAMQVVLPWPAPCGPPSQLLDPLQLQGSIMLLVWVFLSQVGSCNQTWVCMSISFKSEVAEHAEHAVAGSQGLESEKHEAILRMMLLQMRQFVGIVPGALGRDTHVLKKCTSHQRRIC